MSNILAEEAGYELNLFGSSEKEEMDDIIYSLVHEKTMFEDDCIDYIKKNEKTRG